MLFSQLLCLEFDFVHFIFDQFLNCLLTSKSQKLTLNWLQLLSRLVYTSLWNIYSKRTIFFITKNNSFRNLYFRKQNFVIFCMKLLSQLTATILIVKYKLKYYYLHAFYWHIEVGAFEIFRASHVIKIWKWLCWNGWLSILLCLWYY